MKAKIFVGPPATGKTMVAKMIAEFVGIEKTVYLDARHGLKTRFAFSEVQDNTELLIIDDIPLNFCFEEFYNIRDNRPYGGDIKYIIRISKKGKLSRTKLIPYLIFTTEYKDPQWEKLGASFHERFDVVEFPL